MRSSDIPEILAIEGESFPTPWPSSAFKTELVNKLARYVVLRDATLVPPQPEGWQKITGGIRRLLDQSVTNRGPVLGYAGTWIIIDEAHLTTIAVRPDLRGKGYGELLLIDCLDASMQKGAETMTLEVRLTNESAQKLYRKYGFAIAGRRKNYYSEINEDALIMTTVPTTTTEYRERFESLRAKLADRLAGTILVDAH